MPTVGESLSRAQARRVALAAQGIGTPRRMPPTTVRAIDAVMAHTQLLQIDSVNILARAHYLPIYSRLGPYRRELLDRAASATRSRPIRVFEYWAHVASYLPVADQPLLRFRMQAARDQAWGSVRRLASERPDLIAQVRDEVAALGPVTARELTPDTPAGRDNWGWNWSAVKIACEWLFFTGELTSAGRTASFERRYDIPERVFPAEILAAPTPARADATRTLVERSARAHGVGSVYCFRDYFRLGVAETARAVTELVEAGTLIPVRVQGWDRQAYLHRDARLPRRVGAATLLSPFDPVVWERARTEALFDFFYRIEIYVPAHKRIHGYYVLPFLLGDQLVGRVDLKADRATGTLRVLSAHREPRAPGHTAEALAGELRRLAGWLGLERIAVVPVGDLAGAVESVLAGGPVEVAG